MNDVRPPQSNPRATSWAFPACLYGVLVAGGGLAIYLLGVLLGFVTVFVDPHGTLRPIADLLVWYSGLPIVVGMFLVALDLALFLPAKRVRVGIPFDPPAFGDVTVVLTAFNDEDSIGDAVADFIAHPKVRRVIVVDNNSTDQTGEVARDAGAKVVTEPMPGYGSCVFRALSEGMAAGDTQLTLLCEGDRTFRAHDIEKFLAYIPHAEIVNGTRIVEQLRELRTQLTTFMYYGNFFTGKLLEAKHLGRGTFTDVGTTYKLCRNTTLARLLPMLDPRVNLEFNAYFLDTALSAGIAIVECPITFYARVGVSKGGNVDDVQALKVGMRMIRGIVLGWRAGREGS